MFTRTLRSNPKRSRMSDMKKARGRWSEPPSISAIVHDQILIGEVAIQG
jgi:hypothetical protein